MACRCIGLDVHRDFAQVAIWEDGTVRDGGRVGATPQELRRVRRDARPRR